MSGLNKVFLLGNLGADVTLRHLSDGRAVANVHIATTEIWRDKSGEKQKHTEWHRLNFFGRQAEVAAQYMRKGTSLFVEGQLRTNTWTDKENQSRQTTEIRVSQFQLLNSRRDSENESESRSRRPSRKARKAAALGINVKRPRRADQRL